jgi:hypothetical protein
MPKTLNRPLSGHIIVNALFYGVAAVLVIAIVVLLLFAEKSTLHTAVACVLAPVSVLLLYGVQYILELRLNYLKIYKSFKVYLLAMENVSSSDKSPDVINACVEGFYSFRTEFDSIYKEAVIDLAWDKQESIKP